MKLKFLRNNEAIAQAIGGMVALLVAIIIGVLVFYSVNDGITFSQTGGIPAGGTTASRATWNQTNSTAGTVWTLVPIVAIVMIASIILGVVMAFGTRPGAGV